MLTSRLNIQSFCQYRHDHGPPPFLCLPMHVQVVRALHRSQNLGARAERGELQAARVVVTDESTCRGCQRLLGSKIFFR